MGVERAPATVVVCCGVPVGVRTTDFTAWADVVARTRMPVTWAARPADMATVLEVLGLRTAPFDIALALDAADLQSRPILRREIAAANAIVGRVECAVVSGAPVLDHRSLLVEQGIQTIAVGRFDDATRRSRRPPPTGWPCRSMVWGLWEVQSVPEPPRPAAGRLLPWAFGPRVAPGSLTVIHADAGVGGHRRGHVQLERLAGWIVRHAKGVRAARLTDLPELLRASSLGQTGSVLKRAA